MKKPTIKQLSSAVLQAEKNTLVGELEKARKVLEECNRTVTKLYDELQEVTNELDEREMLSHPNTDWEYLLHETGSTSMARYKAAHAAVADLIPAATYGPITFSGYLPTIQQRALQIALIKNDHQLTSAVCKALEEILPHVKKLEDEELGPYKRVSIMESSLSERGSFCIAIDEERQIYRVYNTRYSKQDVMCEGKTLLEVLTYVERSLYYRTYGDE